MATLTELCSLVSSETGLFRNAVVVNGALLVGILYTALYLYLEAFAGLTWALCVGRRSGASPPSHPIRLTLYWYASAALPSILWSQQFYQDNPSDAWKWALWRLTLGWCACAQGHALCEKRRPALLDSFAQSIVSARAYSCPGASCAERPNIVTS
eukprot:scaffold1414_cov384-Prasinococcus_capsulatus_cf.AAC.11